MFAEAKYDLKNDIANSHIAKKLCNDVYAQNLYSALCNVVWQKEDFLTMLEDTVWGVSWRSAGDVVSDLRNTFCHTADNYMDFYCSGMAPLDGYVPEGTITEEIKNDLHTLGWVVRHKYPTEA